MTPEAMPDTRLQGASNFRDLGGLRNRHGQRLRHGMVFRSDHLANLSADDQAALRQMGVTHSMDLRGVQEHAARPYAIDGLRHVPLPIEPTVVRRVEALLRRGTIPTESETVALMCETYQDFVRHHGPTFGTLLRHLIEQPTPQVFHCTAGKDRTGMAAALLLGALDVDRDTVMEDYLLTNQRYRRDAAWEGQGPEHVMAILWQVQEAFLHAAFDEIDRSYGSLQNYLDGPVGLTAATREQLQQRLLLP